MTNTNTNEVALHFPTTRSLEDLAQALAEGEHGLGLEATRAGADLVQWPGSDCPWFTPGPTAIGVEVASFSITEVVS